MADLLSLDLCRPTSLQPHSWLQVIQTPLRVPVWEAALVQHPDRTFARFIVSGIREGFQIGFCRSAPLRPTAQNMHCALEHSEFIQAYLEKECSLGRMLGPFPKLGAAAHLPHCHINRFGVIPKGHNSG